MADILTVALDSDGPASALQLEHPVTGERLRLTPAPGVPKHYQVAVPGVVLPSPYPFNFWVGGQLITQLTEILDLRPPVEPAPALPFGAFAYTPPAGATGSAAYMRDQSTQANVRTLWNNRKETGLVTRKGHWDGRLFDLSTAPTGKYEVVVNYYNITDEYQGCLGNTSLNLADMDAMWRGYDPVYDGVEFKGKTFWTMGYVEDGSPVNSTDTNNPQVPTEVLDGNGFRGQTARRIAVDAADLYVGLYRTIGNKQSYILVTSADNPGAITRFGSLDQQSANLDNVIGGLAVQLTGNVIVVTYPALNKIYTYRKDTKALLKIITTFTAPGACSVDAQDRLVLKTGTATVGTYPINADGTLGAAVVTFSAGLTTPWTVKAAGSLIYVTDHGSGAQNLRAYNAADGTLAWVHGQPGGHNVDARVLPDRYCFATSNGAVNWSSVVPLKSGKFWIIEPAGNRMVLFNADRTPVGGRDGVVSYRSNAYTFALNQNDQSDMTWKAQRFKVRYSDTILNDWEYTHNYLPFLPASQFAFAGDHGDQQNIEYGTLFKSLYTDSMNGGVYAYCQQQGDVFQEYELLDTKLRPAGPTTTTPYSFQKDGSRVVSRYTGTNNANYSWLVEPRTGFDANRNRIVGSVKTPTTIVGINSEREPYDVSGAANGDAYLKTEGGYRPLYQPNLVRRLYGTVGTNGWRLGLVKEGNSKWDMLLNKSTGGISYVGGQPLDGYYTNGDHATYVLRDNAQNPILDANGKQILLSVGYGGSVVRVDGRFLLENTRGEGYHDGQQHQRFLWTEWGVMVHAYGTNTDESRAYTVATGKKYLPGNAGNALTTELTRDKNDRNVLYQLNTGESGSGGIDRTKLVGVDNITSTVLATLDVTSETLFASGLPAGAINLLAKMPAKGDIWRPAKTIYENPGCGWTQSRPDDSTNKFGGGPYWKAEIGTHTYDIFKPNGFYFRYRFNYTGTPDSMYLISDAYATGAGRNNWEMRIRERYPDNNANRGEQDQSNSFGLYRHLKDTAGKVLVRSYLKDLGNGSTAIIANEKTITSGSTRELTDLWRQLRTDADWVILNKDGTVTVQYGPFAPVTLSGPFEAGASFSTDTLRVEYFVWTKTQSLDLAVAVDEPIFTPGVDKPAAPGPTFAQADPTVGRVDLGAMQQTVSLPNTVALKTALLADYTNTILVAADGDFATENFEQKGTWSNVLLVSASGNTRFLATTSSTCIILQGTAARTRIAFRNINLESTFAGGGNPLLWWNELPKIDGFEVSGCSFKSPNGPANGFGCVQYSTSSNQGQIAKNVLIERNKFKDIGRCGIEMLSQGYDGVFRLFNLTIRNNEFDNLGLKNEYGMATSLSGLFKQIDVSKNTATRFRKIAYEFVNSQQAVARDNDATNGTDGAGYGFSDDGKGFTSDIYVYGGTIEAPERPFYIYECNRIHIDAQGKQWKGGRGVQMNTTDGNSFANLNLLIQSTATESGWEWGSGTTNSTATDCTVSSAGSAAAGRTPSFESIVLRSGATGNRLLNIKTILGLRANGTALAGSPQTGADGRIVNQAGDSNIITNNTYSTAA